MYFGYAVDKGWMCVQVFFIRQGKLIERDVSIFPIYNEPEEELLTFLGQFYQMTNHFKPKEILLPEWNRCRTCRRITRVKVITTKTGTKKRIGRTCE